MADEMTTETSPWDSAERLDTPEEIAARLEAAIEDGDPRISTLVGVLKALGLRLDVKAA